jgi:uncharacterized membrane protein
MYDWLLLLHILAFAMSLALTAGVAILAGRVARSRDAKAIHTAFAAAQPLTIVGGVGWLVTAGLGIGLIHDLGIPFSELWVMLSLGIFAVLVVVGFGVHAPWHAKVIAASAGGEMNPALEALLRAPTSPVASAVSAFCVVALTYLMIVKPG